MKQHLLNYLFCKKQQYKKQNKAIEPSSNSF